MDPKPWPNDESSELERTLLEAARGERMPQALSARMAEGLGLQAGAAASGAATAATPLFAKTALWGALSLGLAAASAWYATRPTPVAAPAPASEQPPAAQSIATPAPAQPVELPAEPVVEQAPLAPSRAVAAVRQPERNDANALAAEVELLDRVRAALQEHAAARALSLLDQHRRRFTRATLAPEATALRIEALVHRGSSAEARALASRFANAHPSHPLRDHVAGLISPLEATTR